LGLDGLQRHLLAGEGVAREIDGSGRALAEQLLDVVLADLEAEIDARCRFIVHVDGHVTFYATVPETRESRARRARQNGAPAAAASFCLAAAASASRPLWVISVQRAREGPAAQEVVRLRLVLHEIRDRERDLVVDFVVLRFELRKDADFGD